MKENLNTSEIIQDEIIGKIFPQHCGDSVLVLRKTNQKNKNGHILYEIEYQKYFFIELRSKRDILRGSCINPRIEEEEFIKKEWPQKCGDILTILNKTEEKLFSGILFECEFQKYPYKVKATKTTIKDGQVLNPRIEEEEFINKIWPQHCGDSLKIIKKSDERNINSKGILGSFLFECEFQKYPHKVKANKSDIKSGNILNPRIEEEEFIKKEWPQKCGDTLKILKKTKEKDSSNCHFLFECEFLKYPYKIKSTKNVIKLGNVDNPVLPWKAEKSLRKYIQEFFKEKPTLKELADSLNIAVSTVGRVINQFNLRELIQYYSAYKENLLKKYIEFIYKGKIQVYSGTKKENYYEIDIFIKEKNFGIEFNGNYWHSNLYRENYYHQNKSLFFKEKGINLIHIFEFEWLNKQEICESLIQSKLGIYKQKIGARQCQIKELKNKEYQDFCNKNHLQGEAGARIKLGLFYKEELVQIMSFGSPRFTSSCEWEIIRECSKLGYFIIGGKQKLWSYFVKKYNPNSVISYCDFSKFTGESYLKLGFKFKQLNKPGFWWYNEKTNEVYWRDPYHHKEMKNKGYSQLYDCGQLVFEWKNN